MTARRTKPAPGRARTAARLPDPSGDAPLNELSRDALSVFVYLALLPDETRAIVKRLGLSVPGFRREALGDVERCDVLADEIRTSPSARSSVVEALRKAFEAPLLAGLPLDPATADDVLALGGTDHGLVLALWRVLADPAPEVRARAVPVLDRLAADYYGPRDDGEGPPPERAPGAEPHQRIQALERELEKAKARAEDARVKAEGEREKLKVQLKEARARDAQAVEEAARAREAAGEAIRGWERAEAALAGAQATDAAAEAQRARAAARELEGKLSALEPRLARAAERERELEAALREARERAAPERPAPTAAMETNGEPEEAPATWLMPLFTREFYDSLAGWDRRVQRAAFKQAFLLAQDHRHPSLRALPLEGLPGYYRVRVATDVRLLYRRGERQDSVEILSLIDREDLDRYIKQAKTR